MQNPCIAPFSSDLYSLAHRQHRQLRLPKRVRYGGARIVSNHLGSAKGQTTAEASSSTGVILHRYLDPVEGFSGYVAFDGADQPLAAGGFRVEDGLTAQTIADLAHAMTLKQRLLGLRVNGAKCGIDYSPHAAGRLEAMRRFLQFLRPYLLERFSMGPDAGTTWDEIEQLARAEGIPSAKFAIAKTQGLHEDDFRERLRLLDATVDGLTLGQRRAGHALGCATMAALARRSDIVGPPRVGLQGFGTLARSAALTLEDAGVRVTAIADEHGCCYDDRGLDVSAVLSTPHRSPVVSHRSGQRAVPRALLERPVDVLVLAACRDGLMAEDVPRLAPSLRLVVVGANLGLSADAERLLEDRGITVVPDFVAGAGGSASMDALFGPSRCPSAQEFLKALGESVACATHQTLNLAVERGVYAREAALTLCASSLPGASGRPYGAHDAAPPSKERFA